MHNKLVIYATGACAIIDNNFYCSVTKAEQTKSPHGNFVTIRVVYSRVIMSLLFCVRRMHIKVIYFVNWHYNCVNGVFLECVSALVNILSLRLNVAN